MIIFLTRDHVGAAAELQIEINNFNPDMKHSWREPSSYLKIYNESFFNRPRYRSHKTSWVWWKLVQTSGIAILQKALRYAFLPNCLFVSFEIAKKKNKQIWRNC